MIGIEYSAKRITYEETHLGSNPGKTLEKVIIRVIITHF